MDETGSVFTIDIVMPDRRFFLLESCCEGSAGRDRIGSGI